MRHAVPGMLCTLKLSFRSFKCLCFISSFRRSMNKSRSSRRKRRRRPRRWRNWLKLINRKRTVNSGMSDLHTICSFDRHIHPQSISFSIGNRTELKQKIEQNDIDFVKDLVRNKKLTVNEVCTYFPTLSIQVFVSLNANEFGIVFQCTD